MDKLSEAWKQIGEQNRRKLEGERLTARLLFGGALAVTGWAILIAQSGWISLGIFLLFWARNLNAK